MAIMLRDESRLSMGPQSEITLASFVYAPAGNDLSLVVRMARGVLAYISGRIAKLMPEAVRLEEVPVEDRPAILRRYLQLAPGARPHIPVDRNASLDEFAAVAPRYPVFRLVPADG